KPTCAEALVRWNHPTKGLLPPDLFIPVFEKNEFISKIDSFVLEQVCGVIRDAALNGYPMVPISVNVSRIDLYNPELAHNMLAKIAEYGIDQSMIKVEITESAYRENTDQLLDAMNELRHHGFKISMDDFGSGYSSLNMLKDAPIDILKLDMQFIRDLESSMRAEKLVTSIIKMANLLDI
ncbi:MAG: EAL domain-containing protein, partial [Oscillospiraceae bacterium]